MQIIELHAPTSSTLKLKLMGRGAQFTYIPTQMEENDNYFQKNDDVKHTALNFKFQIKE